jgi:type I restriction enzyme S subunit
MNRDRLMTHYENIADAPDAIARLRRFILDLAVRGKLVSQNSSDEPAPELLKRIATEKARIGVKLTASAPDEGEIRFDLPIGWSWSRIGDVCSKTGSGSTPRGGKEVYKDSGVVFLRSQNIHDDGLRLNDVAYIDQETHSRMSGTKVLPGDLLLNITGGSIGRCCRIPDNFKEANISQHVAIIRPAVSGIKDFLHRLILSQYFQAFVIDEQTGAGRGGLPKNRMDRIAIAIPPLAEQHRIVAKVDELMAFCDGLERAHKAREATRDLLAAASLTRLNAPDPETFQNDARFALDALPTLTARADQIKQLRQTILNLAVRGKLVPQDSHDEPASTLLTRWRDSRGQKTKHGELEGLSSKVPFDHPTGWIWTTVQQTLHRDREISYGVIKLGDEPKNGGVPTLRCSDVRPGFIDLSGVRKVREDIESEYSRTRLSGGEIVINIRGTLGGVALVPQNLAGYNVAREVAVVPIAGELCGPFCVYLMLSSYFWNEIQRNLRGIAYKGLNLGILRDFPISLPPLAEQHRIVAKVDALMALCDRLEASLTATAATRRRLLDALLAEALAPDDARELEAAE